MPQDRLVLGVTGHRPSTLPGGSAWSGQKLDGLLVEFAIQRLVDCELGKPTEVISGMAEGWDLAVAAACFCLGIPFTAALPFRGQESRWQARSQQRYREILAEAAHVEIVSPIASRQAYLLRDEWIVDHSQKLMALCGKATGGTAYTVAYADLWGVPTLNVWNEWIMFRSGR